MASAEKSAKASMSSLPPVRRVVTFRQTRGKFNFPIAVLVIVTLLGLTAVSIYRWNRYGDIFYRKPSNHWNSDDSAEWPEDLELDEPQTQRPFEPLKRYSFDYGRVACWSDNGVWIAFLSPVEMAWLGVDRFRETERAESQAEEDAFCARLRLHGADFWELPPRWPDRINWCSDIHCVPPTKEVSFSVGFPSSGGVWVLDDSSRAPDDPSRKTGGLRSALSMDERCDVLKDMGAYFCEDIKECPRLDAALKGWARKDYVEIGEHGRAKEL